MANVIRLKKGLDIRLAGVAKPERKKLPLSASYTLSLSSFVGLAPKVVVKEGDVVKAGDALFVSKQQPEMKFASPVSGVVELVNRGERRKLLGIKVKADAVQQYADFSQKISGNMSGEQVKALLLEAGLFGYINQLPYAVVADPTITPKGIFVSALRDMPLAGDFEVELKGQEKDFQTGLTALSKMAKTYLGIGAKQTSQALTGAKDVEVTVFDGKCPAGNVGVHVNHLDPVNKGETVWTVDPTAVIFIGRLINTGKVDLTRTVAVAGSEVKDASYVDALVGTPLSDILADHIDNAEGKRIINGNPLTGQKATMDDALGAHT